MAVRLSPVNNREKLFLQPLRDRSPLPLTNRDAVNRPNRRNLSRRPRKEYLISNVEQLTWNSLLHHRNPHLAGQREHRIAGNAGQHRSAGRRRTDFPSRTMKRFSPEPSLTYPDLSSAMPSE